MKAWKATMHHQDIIYILMMIQHIPCKQALVCHVVVESNLYFSYKSVLLHCIDAVMTRVVCSRPFILIPSFDCNGFSHVLFVVEIIQLPLSALLWCMQIHVQNGLKQWAQYPILKLCIQSVCLLSSLLHCAQSSNYTWQHNVVFVQLFTLQY